MFNTRLGRKLNREDPVWPIEHLVRYCCEYYTRVTTVRWTWPFEEDFADPVQWWVWLSQLDNAQLMRRGTLPYAAVRYAPFVHPVMNCQNCKHYNRVLDFCSRSPWNTFMRDQVCATWEE